MTCNSLSILTSQQNNLEVLEATEYLKTVLVVQFAQKLDNQFRGSEHTSDFWMNRANFTRQFANIHRKKFDFTKDLDSIETQESVVPLRLLEDLHRSGINVRHLGLVCCLYYSIPNSTRCAVKAKSHTFKSVY